MPDCPELVIATPTWSLNGPNVFSANLVRGLRARQIRAHIVLTQPDWLDAKPLPRPPDIPFQILPVGRFWSFRARCAAMIRYLEERAPCIYIPNHDFGHSCVSPHLSDRIGIVGVIHSDDPQHYEHLSRLGCYWNAVVAVSEAIARESLKIAPALGPRLAVIPYGVPTPATWPDRAFSTVPPLRAIYAGRLDQVQKRVLDLPGIVRAASELNVPIHLSIAGKGPAEVPLKAGFEALGVSGRVDFLGILESADLSRVFAGQDVFLLTSAFEGMSIGVIEAMAQGCIPVVTDVRSGAHELIADGVDGFRVAIGDIQGFAMRLAELYGNPAVRRRMAAAAFIKAGSGCYRMDRMAQSYLELFGRVQNDARRGAFRRPAGRIQPPPKLPWTEHLPCSIQSWGNSVKRLLGNRRE